jgi:hypothetical protein
VACTGLLSWGRCDDGQADLLIDSARDVVEGEIHGCSMLSRTGQESNLLFPDVDIQKCGLKAAKRALHLPRHGRTYVPQVAIG